MKSALIGGAVGLIFMAGGFFLGLRLVHLPAGAKTAAGGAGTLTITPAPKPAFTVETLRKATQSLLEVNQALQAREAAVAARERKARQTEEEMVAEREALDRSHEKFKALYGEFLSRLQLVKAGEADQLQRQIAIYDSMDSAQVVELLRATDDGTVTKLFSMMDPKPLAKLVSAWKVKYPADATRLLAALGGMGKVVAASPMTAKGAANPGAGDQAASSTAAIPANATPEMPKALSTSAPPADSTTLAPNGDDSAQVAANKTN